MKSAVILAGNIIQFQRKLREENCTLMRAKPFTSSDRKECYAILYMENK